VGRLIRDMRYGPLRPLSCARITPGTGTYSIGKKGLPYNQAGVSSWSSFNPSHRNSKLHCGTQQWVCDG
jgi:hypothetical protein